MQIARYTAILSHGSQVLFEKSHSNFSDLQALLLTRLQDRFSNATGIIIDNTSGHTIHSCRRMTCYD